MLIYLGFRVRVDGDQIWWGIGLPGHEDSDFATGQFVPGGISARAQIASENASVRRIAQQGLRTLINFGLALFRTKDAAATVTAPRVDRLTWTCGTPRTRFSPRSWLAFLPPRRGQGSSLRCLW